MKRHGPEGIEFAAHYDFLVCHPELGITVETEWTPTIVRPHILVLMYDPFFSQDWEMGLRWHVMIPPVDPEESVWR